MHEHIQKLKSHRNILYTVVIILLILQTASFISLSSQVSRLGADVSTKEKNLEKSIEANKEYAQKLNDLTNVQFSKELRDLSQDISKNISKQQESFKSEISMLKSSKDDFSGIVEEAVKSVVSVGTDKSVGSGFIVDESGLILTNEHVVSNARDVKVLLYNGKVIPAEIIGADKVRDIAILKIRGDNYPALTLEEPGNIQVGKKVIAIGNPYGLSFTVTEGIISAINRVGPNGLAEYIQTDVSLNPGNSGGPLINTLGKVVGVNNFKVGSAESIGFALESRAVKEIVNKITNSTILT